MTAFNCVFNIRCDRYFPQLFLYVQTAAGEHLKQVVFVSSHLLMLNNSYAIFKVKKKAVYSLTPHTKAAIFAF